MKDVDRGRLFSHDEVRQNYPELYAVLLHHHETCPVRPMAVDPLSVKRHIIFCRICGVRIANIREMAPLLISDLPRQEVETIGLIGFGRFGAFIAKHLSIHFDVVAHDIVNRADSAAKIRVRWEELKLVAAQEAVILAIPLQAFRNVLEEIVPHVHPRTLVMDVCSVKVEPLRLMREYLPLNEVFGTHPLFGPESASDGIRGHKIAVCQATHGRSSKSEFVLKVLSEEMNLKVIEIGAEEHDREMAKVQVLTHFVARALSELGMGESQMSTVSHEHLVEAAKLLGNDSWELFETIQNGNPFGSETRNIFLKKLIELDLRLKK